MPEAEPQTQADDAVDGDAATPLQGEAPREAIPRPLLERLLHDGFEDADTRIQKGAMALVAKYMDTFVREAVARAAFERADAARADAITDDFLQVEDLERLVPQLMLDF